MGVEMFIKILYINPECYNCATMHLIYCPEIECGSNGSIEVGNTS